MHKNKIITFIFILSFFFTSGNIVKAEFNENIYNKVMQEYYFNQAYALDKYTLIETLITPSIDKKERLYKCLLFGKKYYKQPKLGCVIQLKYTYRLFKNNLFKNIEKEEFDLYQKYIDDYTHILIKNIHTNNHLKKEEEKLISPYIDDNLGYHNMIKPDLEELKGDYNKYLGKQLIINSGYRNIDSQQKLYDYYISNYGPNQKNATIPGTSEHHLGTALDFKRDSNNYIWLKENSYKYGFIQTYDTQNCNGIHQEDWHYRWVGKKIASKWKDWKDNNPTVCNLYFYDFLKNKKI